MKTRLLIVVALSLWIQNANALDLFVSDGYSPESIEGNVHGILTNKAEGKIEVHATTKNDKRLNCIIYKTTTKTLGTSFEGLEFILKYALEWDHMENSDKIKLHCRTTYVITTGEYINTSADQAGIGFSKPGKSEITWLPPNLKFNLKKAE
jgi:hypothetical protein